jgi:hypothetical protein
MVVREITHHGRAAHMMAESLKNSIYKVMTSKRP